MKALYLLNEALLQNKEPGQEKSWNLIFLDGRLKNILRILNVYFYVSFIVFLQD